MTNTQSRDIFGVVVRKNNHKDIRRLKRESGVAAIHGNKFWKSTSLLIDYIQTSPPKPNMSILEIGFGWGIGSIFVAKNYGAIVTALDADESVFPYLHYHAHINGVAVETIKERYENVTTDMLSKFDMVIASDICFWDEMTQPLSNLIHRCYEAGVERVVMTDPGRQPFRDMAEVCSEKYAAIYENWSVPHPYNISGLLLDIE
jgi:predicted nicotinamide N-methyase